MFSALVCMATAIYFEARSEPMAGQFAVGHVIMNRVHDERYPNHVCEVITQGKLGSSPSDKIVIDECQFSFWCDGKSDEPTDLRAFEIAIDVSRMMLAGIWYDPTEGATHYHSTGVSPEWKRTKTRVVRIENHIFYRWEQGVPDNFIRTGG